MVILMAVIVAAKQMGRGDYHESSKEEKIALAQQLGNRLLIVAHGANPLIVAPIAMLAGYCGTLMTPMAANFNIVPAALLEMRSKYGVIRAHPRRLCPHPLPARADGCAQGA